MDDIKKDIEIEKKVKAKVWSEILDSFTMKCYLEHEEKGHCAICDEPAATLKIITELTREEYIRSRSVEYCKCCFEENIFVPPLPKQAQADFLPSMYQ